jgi:predicted Rossmann fold nucleotide-binding protein DprA/Smf involved in DNA uptake
LRETDGLRAYLSSICHGKFESEIGQDRAATAGGIRAEIMDSFEQYQPETDGRKMRAEFDLLPQQLELREALPENPTEARLLGALDETGDPQHIDELCRATGLPVAEVSGALVMMELKGLTRLVGPMTYIRAH